MDISINEKIVNIELYSNETQNYIKYNLFCQLCTLLMKDPIRMCETHFICRNCKDEIEQQIKKTKGVIQCPFDRKPFREAQSDASFLKQQIKLLLVHCPHSSNHRQLSEEEKQQPILIRFIQPKCQWKGSVNQLENHLSKQCLGNLQICTEPDCGMLVQIDEFEHHLSQECMHRLIKCPLTTSKEFKLILPNDAPLIKYLDVHQTKFLIPNLSVPHQFTCNNSKYSYKIDEISKEFISCQINNKNSTLHGFQCPFDLKHCEKCDFITFANLKKHCQTECNDFQQIYQQVLIVKKQTSFNKVKKLDLLLGDGLINQSEINIFVKKFIQDFDLQIVNKINLNHYTITLKSEDELLELVNFWKVVNKKRMRINNTTISVLYRGVLEVKNKVFVRNIIGSQMVYEIIALFSDLIEQEIVNKNKNVYTMKLTFANESTVQDLLLVGHIYIGIQKFKVVPFYDE